VIKKLLFALALLLLPSAAMAQHHEHHASSATKSVKAAAHMNFAKELIALRADLKLTDDQVKKLEALSVKMDEMHKQMAAGHHGNAAEHAKHEDRMHSDLLAVFSAEQLVKVQPLMKAHMEKCKAMKQGSHKH
jgi:hypothetical protein